MKKYIEIDGVKYQIDPNDETKALVDDKGEKVPYKEDDDKKDNDTDKKVDLSKISIEELKKSNPEVAKAFSQMDEITAKLQEKESKEEEAQRKQKEEQGKWQELFEEEQNKRKLAEDSANKLKVINEKYDGTIKGILEEQIKSIPEDRRSLIPSDYSARKKLEYITNNAKSLGVVAGGKKGGEVPPNDKDINLDEESKVRKEYEDLLKKGKDRTSIETAQMLELAKKVKEIQKANEEKK